MSRKNAAMQRNILAASAERQRRQQGQQALLSLLGGGYGVPSMAKPTIAGRGDYNKTARRSFPKPWKKVA